MEKLFITLLEECTQIFLTDTSQYLIISGADTETRTKFLHALSEMPSFKKQEISQETLISTKKLNTTLDTLGQKNVAIYFLDNPNSLSFSDIRTIIDQKMIDSKIILTLPEALDIPGITNFSLEQLMYSSSDKHHTHDEVTIS